MTLVEVRLPVVAWLGLLASWLAFLPRSGAQSLEAPDTATWFPVVVRGMADGAVTDMSTWLDAPAGKHGFLTARGDDYTFEDGTPVTFWGVNLGTYRVFPEEDEVDKWVSTLSKFGINAVRLHKFTWDATDGVHSTQLTPSHWERLDRFARMLREAGIYYGWSHIYGHRVLPADSARMLAYGEVRELEYPWAHLNGSTSGLVNFAEDLQDINIELTVNMLEHRNPDTGLRYADDPALAFVELQNEDDIFWGALMRSLEQAPTYRALLCRKFSDWLRAKYGTEEALQKAWGGEGIASGNSLAEGTIFPRPDHGWFSSMYAEAEERSEAVPAHVRDRARFLYEEQMHYYTRAAEAIRATGYRGVIITSCWQAGSGITHFYNLYADASIGPVDRHNYWGGGEGHRLRPGPFRNISMLADPGSGLVATGLQQVAGRPFQFSEWMSLIPNEWTAEAAPLVAAYGLGLQGWDASFAFAMDFPHYTPGIDARGGIYNVMTPTQLALYPALAAMIYREDVTEGSLVGQRAVTLDDLGRGRLPFTETIRQDHDRKEFSGGIGPAALLRGRVTVAFGDTARQVTNGLPTETADTITSVTEELRWIRTGIDRAMVSINTAGTQGVIGFSGRENITFSDVTLLVDNPFAVVIVSSLDPDLGIAKADRLLVTTMARARNTEMRFDPSAGELLDAGRPPTLLEPVRAQLVLHRPGAKVYVLDQSGVRTGSMIPLVDGRFLLDGGRVRTFYYEVSFLGE